MRVILLGTGGSAGVPMIGGEDGTGDWGACDPAEPRNRRTRASIVVESGQGTRLLVDTSPDMRTQLLDCRIPSVDAILYTHAHADHITGLDDVRILNRIVDRPLDAFATANTLDEMTRRFGYAFRPWEPPGFFRPVLVPREVRPTDTITAAGMRSTCSSRTTGSFPRSACVSAASATRPTSSAWTTRRSRRWRAWTPGWSIASCAKARTRRTPIWRQSWPGANASGRAGPC